MSHMNLVDLLIIIVALFALERGYRLGLVTQGLSLVGFFGGLFLGSLVVPWISTLGHDGVGRFFLTLVATLGTAAALSALGELVGLRLRDGAKRLGLDSFDGILGGIFEVAAVLLTAWLVAAPLDNLQLYNIASFTRRSIILQRLTQALPPAPDVIARLEYYIEPNGFPRVFLGAEPSPNLQALPPASAIAAAARRDAGAVVKIEGAGCGGIIDGSGFVAASGLVATNAHVVAGIAHPWVIDSRGRHGATVVYFNPNLDFALLRTTNLSAAPLAINAADVPRGTAGAVLGYPGGGPYTAVPAAVSQQRQAIGRNIYNTGLSTRQIYEIQGDVEPGNSGGPLIDTNGTVIGVVFAKSTEYQDIGYTLTSSEVLPIIRSAGATAVNTGLCTPE
jgi:S1-C subfamily serine protease